MKCSTSSEKLNDLIKFTRNVAHCSKFTGSSVSVENLSARFETEILSSKFKARQNAFEKHHQSLRRNSRSETNLFKNGEGLSENDNEVSEKTEDTLARALNTTLKGDRKELFKKTELEQEYIGDPHQYSDSLDSVDNMMPPLQSPTPGVVTDSQGLIVPKKIMNPCLESSDRQNLHRELMFNQKIGKNVLNQKSELQRALEKQKERQFIHQQSNTESSGTKNELNRVIMERAQRIEKKTTNEDEIDNQLNPEYLNARAKLRTRIDSK